jgi:hypothetical protein
MHISFGRTAYVAGTPADILETLEEAAWARINEMSDYTSGELNQNISEYGEEGQKVTEYTGWWEKTTENTDEEDS